MKKAIGTIGVCMAVATLLLAPAAPAAAADPHPMLVQINDRLALEGAEVRVEMAEYVTVADGPEFGNTIIAENRGNKQLGSHFVPNDPLRGNGTTITWANDPGDGATSNGLIASETASAIRSSMQTWQDQTCSTIPLLDLGDAPFDLGYVQWLFGFGGIPGWVADLTHAGWLPGAFFDQLAPGGSNFILGVTFTFIWIDDVTGQSTDMDNNGKQDTAFREIYYNDAFTWNIDGSSVDVESIALHEAGHGLSQGHFGKVFRDNKGRLKFAPRAVMNAVYVGGSERDPFGTDNGGHCSIWGSWPNN